MLLAHWPLQPLCRKNTEKLRYYCLEKPIYCELRLMGHFGRNLRDQNDDRNVDNEGLDHEVSDGRKGMVLEAIHVTFW